MSEVITVTNQKGGVGKTTVTAALVCGLRQRGARVLGIDLDPQGNLAFSLGLDIGVSDTIYDVLKGPMRPSRTQNMAMCSPRISCSLRRRLNLPRPGGNLCFTSSSVR